MYKIYANDVLLHDPRLAETGRIVISPVLTERLGTFGSLKFSVANTNPLASTLEPRKTLVKVVGDNKGRKIWFGRVSQIGRGWNNLIDVVCDGELSCMCDAFYQPFGFKGSPSQLLKSFIDAYNATDFEQDQAHYTFALGDVTVTDNNNYIVRSSNIGSSVWEMMNSKLTKSNLGGYIVPRYDEDNDIHYIDYLDLSDADTSPQSSQSVEFGKNLLDFEETISPTDVITCLYPYGARLGDTDPGYAPNPPENGVWNGNRLTIDSVNNGDRYIIDSDGVALWGKVWGSKIWDDITVAQNLKTAATKWLSQNVWQNITIELNAVDLSYIDVDISQIHIGEYVQVKSLPHNIKVKLLCTTAETPLTNLGDSVITLGAGFKRITDIQTKEDNRN